MIKFIITLFAYLCSVGVSAAPFHPQVNFAVAFKDSKLDSEQVWMLFLTMAFFAVAVLLSLIVASYIEYRSQKRNVSFVNYFISK